MPSYGRHTHRACFPSSGGKADETTVRVSRTPGQVEVAGKMLVRRQARSEALEDDELEEIVVRALLQVKGHLELIRVAWIQSK